ncbi:hypothetical protein GCM10022243_57750 [Saccharothrix violaceirubra]|uniref:DUF6292 domain-containing protein n=1 Tax=Saccharothrix violaceirubra TaxID=413306 RepID=A0A7W7WWN7_9PSEU|nr:DUF6292 family protein [Saccharothrix violaceirubra]MBB4965793.1 hypothetical protein [Saccharothrix violaceirubra]
MERELDFDDAIVRGLRGYVRLVASALGVSGECFCIEDEHPASAYLALDGESALLWNEHTGWSAVREPVEGQVVEHARLDGELLPSPEAVAAWLSSLPANPMRVAAPVRTPAGLSPADLYAYAYAGHLVPEPRRPSD